MCADALTCGEDGVVGKIKVDGLVQGEGDIVPVPCAVHAGPERVAGDHR